MTQTSGTSAPRTRAVIAEAMTLPAAQREMLAIADAYERVADHIERTAGRRAKRRGA
jgi:hypothetical protein